MIPQVRGDYFCLIPARGGSKRIPAKNLRLFRGKPLVVWSIEHALAVGLRPWVISDSRELLAIATAAGAETIVEPAELAGDEVRMLDVIRYAMPQKLPVLLLQPSSPLRDPRSILWACERFERGDCDTALTASRFRGFVLDDGGRLLNFCLDANALSPLGQSMPPQWLIDGAVYVMGNTELRKTNDTPFGRMGIVETDPLRAVELDWPDDWERAERLAELLEEPCARS